MSSSSRFELCRSTPPLLPRRHSFVSACRRCNCAAACLSVVCIVVCVLFDSFICCANEIRVWLRLISISPLSLRRRIICCCFASSVTVVSCRCSAPANAALFLVCCACCCVRLRGFALFWSSLLCVPVVPPTEAIMRRFPVFGRLRHVYSSSPSISLHLLRRAVVPNTITCWKTIITTRDRNYKTRASRRAVGLLLRFDHDIYASCCPLT